MKPVRAPLTALTPPVMAPATTGTVNAMPMAMMMELIVVMLQVKPMPPEPGSPVLPRAFHHTSKKTLGLK
jgi:hypothetical protein